MPSPLFIVCSEAGSVDRLTNQLSIYGVIDELLFWVGQHGPPDSARPLSLMRVTAVWRRGEGDSERQFEFKTSYTLPGESTEHIVGSGPLVFKSPTFKIVSIIPAFGMPKQEGTLTVSNCIRQVGEADWLCQHYAIPIHRLETAAARTS